MRNICLSSLNLQSNSVLAITVITSKSWQSREVRYYQVWLFVVTEFFKTKFDHFHCEVITMSEERYIEPVSNYYELEAAGNFSANQLMEIGTLRPHNNNNNSGNVVVDTRWQYYQSFFEISKSLTVYWWKLSKIWLEKLSVKMFGEFAIIWKSI